MYWGIKRRKDSGMHLIINMGIYLSTFLGIYAAAKYLSARGVPLPIALRVFLFPNRRRQVPL